MAIKRNPRAAEIRSAQAVAEVDQNEKIPTIHFVPAYDGGVCDLSPKEVWPYPVVFDLAGMEPIQVLPIVRDHNQDLPIGQTESVKYGPAAITAVGKMLNVGIDESADKILKLAKRGAKLQASISTDLIGREEIEFFDRGQQSPLAICDLRSQRKIRLSHQRHPHGRGHRAAGYRDLL